MSCGAERVRRPLSETRPIVRGAEDGANLELVGLDLALLEGKVGEEGERRRVRLQVHQQHLHVLVGA